MQWWAWGSILAGWVLTTAVVAALTGLLNRDEHLAAATAAKGRNDVG